MGKDRERVNIGAGSACFIYVLLSIECRNRLAGLFATSGVALFNHKATFVLPDYSRLRKKK